MEDFEKYVFDPEHPKQFKVFKLFNNIISNDEVLAYIDKDFIIEIFNKEIFDTSFNEKIWDIPQGYSNFNTNQKKDTFIANYSEKEFDDFVILKSKKFPKNKLDDFISGLIGLYRQQHLRGNNRDKETNLVQERELGGSPFSNRLGYNYLTNEKWFDYFSHSINGSLISFFQEKNIYNHKKHLINSNSFFFINNTDEFKLINEFKLVKSSLLFTSIKNLENYISILGDIKNLKPIFFKRNEDIHQLFEIAKRNKSKKIIVNSDNEIPNPVNSCVVTNYFSIKKVHLKNLKSYKEIYFIGENGDGKTLLLQSILLSLVGNQTIPIIANFLKSIEDKIFLKARDSKGKIFKYEKDYTKQKDIYKYIYAYGVNRFQNDSDKKEQYGFSSLFSHGEYLENPIAWLKYLDHKEKSDELNVISLANAISLLNELLEKKVEIEVSPDNVFFYERGTKLEFEQLSDGYKSVLVWMCDLLSRLSTKQPNVEHISDFHGIVLVDEIGMFLHPKWQRTIVKKLRTTFPNIQFFFTTHSPIVLLGASEDAVFYKVYKEDGETKVSDPIENKSLGHLMANGIITAPFLFGLESARSESYDPKTDDLETSDDYLTGKIHEAVSKKIAQKNNISEDQIMDLIQSELDKYEAQKND